MTQIDLQIGHKIRTKRRKLGVTQAWPYLKNYPSHQAILI